METTDNQKIKLVADVTLLYDNKVLLVTYRETNKYDHQQGWFLPDDLINFNEHPEDGGIRLLSEQLGYIAGNLSLDHIESFIGGDKSWHLVFHYVLQTDSLPEILPSENIQKWEWFDITNLPDDKDIAHHGWAKFTINQVLSNLL